MGSSVALCRALGKEGIEASIIIEDEVANNLKFLLEDIDLLHIERDKKYFDNIDEEYIAVCVDCGDYSRFAKRKNIFEKASTKICIDHHLTSEGIGDLNFIDSEASATAQIVYLMLRDCNFNIDIKMGEAIFAGITTDTGNFQYSNTNKLSHSIANQLYDIGVDFNKVSVELYERQSLAAIKLQGRVLDELVVFAGGRAAISFVSQKMLEETGAKMDDSEGFVSKIRSIDGVEIAGLLREEKEGFIKGSLRAKGDVDVSSICQEFGGGGHRKAAGFKMEKTLKEAINIVMHKLTLDIEA